MSGKTKTNKQRKKFFIQGFPTIFDALGISRDSQTAPVLLNKKREVKAIALTVYANKQETECLISLAHIIRPNLIVEIEEQKSLALWILAKSFKVKDNSFTQSVCDTFEYMMETVTGADNLENSRILNQLTNPHICDIKELWLPVLDKDNSSVIYTQTYAYSFINREIIKHGETQKYMSLRSDIYSYVKEIYNTKTQNHEELYKEAMKYSYKKFKELIPMYDGKTANEFAVKAVYKVLGEKEGKKQTKGIDRIVCRLHGNIILRYSNVVKGGQNPNSQKNLKNYQAQLSKEALDRAAKTKVYRDQGLKIQEIADLLHVSIRTVNRDIAVIKALWGKGIKKVGKKLKEVMKEAKAYLEKLCAKILDPKETKKEFPDYPQDLTMKEIILARKHKLKPKLVT